MDVVVVGSVVTVSEGGVTNEYIICTSRSSRRHFLTAGLAVGRLQWLSKELDGVHKSVTLGGRQDERTI
jgi:hypothetical protein